MPYESICEGETAGFLHTPAGESRGSLILTHGAGGNCRAPLLVTVATAFELAGYYVLRYDLPFRQRKAGGPPHPSQAGADRDGLRAAVFTMQGIGPGPVFLGGHSYGGRQASILVSEEPALAAALLLLSYPLHPPDKPAQLRTAHFPLIRTPALFVHGEKDPFGTFEEMKLALSGLDAAHELVMIRGAGHDLKRGAFDLGMEVVLAFEKLTGAERVEG